MRSCSRRTCDHGLVACHAFGRSGAAPGHRMVRGSGARASRSSVHFPAAVCSREHPRRASWGHRLLGRAQPERRIQRAVARASPSSCEVHRPRARASPSHAQHPPTGAWSRRPCTWRRRRRRGRPPGYLPTSSAARAHAHRFEEVCRWISSTVESKSARIREIRCSSSRTRARAASNASRCVAAARRCRRCSTSCARLRCSLSMKNVPSVVRPTRRPSVPSRRCSASSWRPGWSNGMCGGCSSCQ